MAGATYVLDKTYKIVNAAGVGKYLAVGPSVANNEGECDLPTADGAAVWGITQEKQATQNENVVVRKYGISRFVASGALTPGMWLMVEANTGKLKQWVRTVTGAIDIVGRCESVVANGAIGYVFMSSSPGSKTA